MATRMNVNGISRRRMFTIDANRMNMNTMPLAPSNSPLKNTA